MTHFGEEFVRAPAHLSLTPSQAGRGAPAGVAQAQTHEGAGQGLGEVRLLVKGQGTIGFAIAERAAFSVAIRSSRWDARAFRWDVGFDGVRLFERIDGEWRERAASRDAGFNDPAGLDDEPACVYWFSLDSHNGYLRYGKGEMRLHCTLVEHRLMLKLPDSEDPGPDAWLREAPAIDVTARISGNVDVWRDPVVVEPALKVIPHDVATMDDIAHGKVTVPANLTATCQILYDNVAGKAFQLEKSEAFDFAAAIKASIADPDGWCYKTLDHKAREFGSYDPLKTYLRITMGQNQGDSPGIPFVMEIWPVDHYSPIHNHGGADAVIKVLHGEITVDMYPMLSLHHQQPFARATFAKGDVTWISPRLNQVHKLTNLGKDEPCITIQCYMYADNNLTHWPYFDYLAASDVGHFDPNSDADYLAFKALMKGEWDDKYAKRRA